MSHVQGRVCPIFHFNWLRSIGVALIVTGLAHAVTITVPCSGSGGGPGGLATAISTANSTLGPNTINLTPGCAYTLTRTYRAGSPNGLPPITGIITINGYGATIGRSQVVGTPTFRLFAVLTGGNLTLNTVTVRGGSLNNGGGGTGGEHIGGGGLTVDAGAKLTLNHSVVTENHLSVSNFIVPGGSSSGGGIYNLGTVTLNYSLVSKNVAESGSEGGGGDGGGIYNRGALTLWCSTVTHNTASGSGASSGGIFSAGKLVMRYGLVSYNTAAAAEGVDVGDADAMGGGILVARTSTAILAYSVIRNNIATGTGEIDSQGLGGGIEWEGTGTLYRAVVLGNTATSNGSDTRLGPNAAGGGLRIFPRTPGDTAKVTLVYTLVRYNIARAPDGVAEGGGIENEATAALKYSKVLDNTAAGATLADSLGGGIYNSNSASGAVILTGTTVADNHPDQCDPTGSVPGCSN